MTTMKLVALGMLEQGSPPLAPRTDPQSTALSFEEENEENRPPPTLLQHRKMDPLSPIAFNFVGHCHNCQALADGEGRAPADDTGRRAEHQPMRYDS